MKYYTNLLELKDISDQGDDRLLSSFVRLHDIGFDSQKNAASISDDEIRDLNVLVNQLVTLNGDKSYYNDFLLGYKPVNDGLTEQFDVLRFSGNEVINLEIKSDFPENDKVEGLKSIKFQMRKHAQYLNTLHNLNVVVCCYLRSENLVYLLENDKKSIVKISFEQLLDFMKRTAPEPHTFKEIDLTDMIVSPYVDPNNFMTHEYFLTNDQFRICEKVTKMDKNLAVIEGGAGTGKTLVLLDIAKRFEKQGLKSLIIFCSPMNNYKEISEVTRLNIQPIRNFSEERLSSIDYDVILVDEAQRMYQSKLDIILNLSDVKRVISVDKAQTLHAQEDQLNFHCDYKKDSNILYQSLSEKIRSDVKMASFIRKLINNKKSGVHPYEYNKVKLKYCSSNEKAAKFIDEQIESEGFVSIEPTEYKTKTLGRQLRKKITPKSMDVHQVIGREYNKVIVVIDKNYYVEEDGLRSRNIEYYPYKQVTEILEAATRTKDLLQIVVIDNPDVYMYIQSILNWKADKEYYEFEATRKANVESQKLAEAMKNDENLNDSIKNLASKIERLADENSLSVDAIATKIRKNIRYGITK